MSRKKVTVDSLSPKLLKAKYAVRGEILVQANIFDGKLKKGDKSLPFDKIVFCNIGNPQRLDQKPLTFVRNVLSLCTSPQLLGSIHVNKIFNKDEIERAKMYVKNTPGQLGGYTHSQGLDFIRREVSEFIAKRDNLPISTIDRIFLTDGASTAIQTVLFSLIRDEKDGIMVPVPQYPLYSASISLYGGSQVSYYLSEEDDWGVFEKELQRSYDEAKKNGINVRSMVVINPGNPTGQIIKKDVMVIIAKFCFENNIVLLADEVYQENVYDKKLKWYSFKKIVSELGETYVKDFELVSFHSVSKGFFGECGRRGGYMEFSQGFKNDVISEMYKMRSICLCPNLDGQITTGIMVNPPKKGDASYKRFLKEKNDIISSLGKRSTKLTKALNNLEDISCNPSKGAMYAFPQVVIPKKAVEEAEKKGMVPDLFYCLELLKETGICKKI